MYLPTSNSYEAETVTVDYARHSNIAVLNKFDVGRYTYKLTVAQN